MEMADTIQRLRIERGWTQEELGNMVGLKKSAIAKYEKGRVINMKRSTIQKMADVFGVSPSYLMGFSESESSDVNLVRQSSGYESKHSIGEMIRRLREQRDIQQTDLAERIGVSKQTMYKYENDIVTNIPADKVQLMANVFHVDPGVIMGWTTLSDYSKIGSGEMKRLMPLLLKLSDDNLEKIYEIAEFFLSKQQK